MISGKVKYTDKQIDTILKSMNIIIDTREKNNKNIVEEYFDKHKIPYTIRKLDCGDYSFMIPKNVELGIYNDLTFEDEIVIERKNSCDELAGNITKDKARLDREFSITNAKIHMMIEDDFHNMTTGNYRSQLNKRALMGALYSFENKYNLSFKFIPKEDAGKHIYCTFYYYLRNQLK